MPWKKLSTKEIYRNKWFIVREDQVIRPNGEPGVYAVVDTYGAGVFVVALNEKQQFPLVNLHRYPTNMSSWELPGGNANELSPLQGAQKELEEETGLTAKTWQEAGTFQAWNGVSSEMEFTFIAQELTQHDTNEQAEEGITDIKWVTFAQAFEMIKAGDITDDQSITAITQAALLLGIIAL